MVIIEQVIQDEPQSASSSTYDVNVPSQDCFIFLSFVVAAGTNPSSVKFNGVNMTQVFNVQDAAAVVTYFGYILKNPPMGTSPLTINFGSAVFQEINILVLSGVDKSVNTYQVKSSTNNTGTTTINLAYQNLVQGSLFLAMAGSNSAIATVPVGLYRIWQDTTTPNVIAVGSVSGQYICTWPGLGSTQADLVTIVFPPAKGPSIWQPNVTIRQPLDLVKGNDLDQFNFVGAQPANLREFGPKPLQLWQNSFLHTVGRIIDNEPTRGSSTKGLFNAQSGIIIDHVTTNSTNGGFATTLIFDHYVSRSDAVLVVVTANTGNNASTPTYNGVPLTRISLNLDSANIAVGMFLLINPPVGTYPVVVTSFAGSTRINATAITLLGVNKRKKYTEYDLGGTGTSLTTSFNVSTPIVNSLVLDAISVASTNNLINVANSEQNQLLNDVSNNLMNFGISFKYVSSKQTALGWNIKNSVTKWSEAIGVFEPDKTYSIWNPSINLRNSNDLIGQNSLNTGTKNKEQPFGYFPSTFYLNSFLHTVGRMLNVPPTLPTVTNETERPTSQIIIDRVFQGQIASQALSTVTLSLQVSIPSPDAVLVVTGGSVIATGNPWANVQFNGNNLTKVVQASVAGADAEIWYMPNPPVGTYTLLITSGTGGEIYANAMVLLGVDKKNTNLISASTTDAASTSSITTQLQNDAQGALIIDTVSASDTAQPIQDQLQTQVFNATALAGIENVLSTYKIAQPGQVTMSYNLTTVVNAAMVAVAFRQAKAPSLWNPNIDLRTIDDTVTTAGLDAERNPAFGNYGYKPSIFWKNSFLHTIGRFPQPTTYITGLLNRLAAYYNFDENTGNTIYDKSGNRNHIQFRGDLTSGWETDGKINSAGKFNGANNVGVLGSIANNTPFNTKEITFGGWFWIDSQQRNGSPHLINLGSADQAAIYFNTASKVINYKISINGVTSDITFINSTNILLNQWVHIFVVFTGQQIIGYLNSKQIGTITNSGGNINFSSNAIIIGAQDSGPATPFFGKIDEVGIWNRALSSYEIKTLYNLGKGLSYPFTYNNNQFPFGIYGYNYYAQGQNAYAEQNFPSSFLQTVGRLIPPKSAVVVNKGAPSMMMMGVGM